MFGHAQTIDKNIVNVKVNGYVMISSVGRDIIESGHNQINQQYINYIENALLGQVTAPTNMYVLLQPLGIQLNLQSFTFKNNQLQLQFTSQSTPSTSYLQLYTVSGGQSILVASYNLSQPLLESTNPLGITWVISFNITSTLPSNYEQTVYTQNIVNMLAYFTAPFTSQYTSTSLSVTPAPPSIQATPTPSVANLSLTSLIAFQISQPTSVSFQILFNQLPVIAISQEVTPPPATTPIALYNIAFLVSGD